MGVWRWGWFGDHSDLTAEQLGWYWGRKDWISEMEENYPEIGIDSSARVLAEGNGWRWKVVVHFVGADDRVESSSMVFNARQECVYNLVQHYSETIQLILDQYK